MKKLFLYNLLAVFSVAIVLGACMFGAVPLSIFHLTGEQQTILVSMRIPRVLLGFFVGSGLSICGVVYQSLFRNPLASPYTLGISSGAALGASVASLFVTAAISISVAGIAGAGGAIVLLLLLNRARDASYASRLLLSGVMISFFFSSLILFSQYLGDFTAIVRLTRWLMGSVETVGYSQLFMVSFVVVAGAAAILALSRELSLFSMGEEIALSKGVETSKVIWLLFSVTSLMIGVMVSICGPIGFIGVAVPLGVRALGSVSHREQLILSFFLGGDLLVLCDALGRTVISPAEIPVGVISALIGAPVVIWLISRRGILTSF